MDIENTFFNTSDYCLLEDKKLGEGSYGTVYIATSKKDENLYAVKIIKAEGGLTGRQQNTFLRESLILRQLSHPAIVKLVGINLQSFFDKKRLVPAIITEYLNHGSLQDMLIKERRSTADDQWTPTKKYICLLGIANAMKYLHSHGFIHRDLKPENVLLDSDYYPRVSDFGLSRCFPQRLVKKDAKALTNFVGTPIYMAPEIIKSENEYTSAVDVYSFSILAYEILTAIEAYQELHIKSVFELSQKVLSGCRPQLNAMLSPKMQELLTQCWSEKPEDRPTFEDIFQKLSTDFSYTSETIDEDEVERYIQLMDESGEPSGQSLEELRTEVNKLKKINQRYQIDFENFQKSSNEMIAAFNSLHGSRSERNYNQAVTYLNISSDKGCSHASLILGLLYENGEGVDVNFDKAREYYEKTAQQGNSNGYFRLGRCYQYGKGVEQDYQKALQYYHKAIESNNTCAFDQLGTMYDNGIGVEKDRQKAFSYYKKSADLGNSYGMTHLGLWYKSEENSNSILPSIKDICYETGQSPMKENIARAIYYFQQAAQLGNALALYTLGTLYDRGEGVAQDKQKALEYYQKAADSGSEEAKQYLESIDEHK